MNEELPIPCSSCDRSLTEVLKDYGECLRSGGSHDEIDEWSVYDESFRRLVSWAEEIGSFYPALRPLKEGGREHDLSFVPGRGEWLKYTKPSAAGYVVSFDSGMPSLEPALPIEYFARLSLQNEIFGDTISYVGLAGERYHPRIVTRQIDVPGIAANDSEIIGMMTGELGFTLLPQKFSIGYADSLAFFREDVAVFDMRPANVVHTPDGFIVPIDSIPVRLNDDSRSILARS